jgi:hypothetical protein
MNGYRLRTLLLAELAQADAREMTAFAESVCKGSAIYLAPRLQSYGRAVCTSDAGGLAAFELIDEFEESGERCIYLGPLFSRGGACVPLFCGFVQGLLEQPAPFHLLAETQNPEATLLFKTLFAAASYPQFDDKALPADIVRVAERFAARLDHIHDFDAANLATRSGETLFRRKPGCEAVLGWLERRGVFLDRGDSQVLVLSCPSAPQRAAALADFREGVRRLASWAQERPRMLACFERGARHE